MSAAFGLFERYGVELEYMIVRQDTLDVLPVSDEVLRAVAGTTVSELDIDTLSWSNELVLHVIELKTNGPAPTLDGLAEHFAAHVARINGLLAPLGGRLMPGAMHPWMDPLAETRLWPHDYSPVYAAFDRIFNCRGHGWSNLQSIHLNLPFANDEQFARLHAAIRLVLPILPALAASSPIVDGHATGLADTRLEVYRSNARRIPAITGAVVPEPVFTQNDYEEQILRPIYAALEPLDPEGVLQDEWANARGAIARFSRNTIEIRVLDIQECPAADLALLRLVTATIRALVEQRWASFDRQRAWPVAALEPIFLTCVRDAERAALVDGKYLRMFGLKQKRCTARELWEHVANDILPSATRAAPPLAPLQTILTQGSLASRLLRRLDGDESPARLHVLYRELCDCLATGRMLQA